MACLDRYNAGMPFVFYHPERFWCRRGVARMEHSQPGTEAPQAGASSSSGTQVAGADTDASSSKAESHPVSRLPPQYFQPPDAFDAVHHMLESLPEQLGEAFVQGQIQQTQVVLDSINSQLSARVMRSYGAFVHGMSQVRTAAHC